MLTPTVYCPGEGFVWREFSKKFESLTGASRVGVTGTRSPGESGPGQAGAGGEEKDAQGDGNEASSPFHFPETGMSRLLRNSPSGWPGGVVAGDPWRDQGLELPFHALEAIPHLILR